MKMRSLTSLLFVACFSGLPFAANAAQQINWQDLTIPVPAADDPYFGLEYEQRLDLEELLFLNSYDPSVSGEDEDISRRMQELGAEMTEAGLDPVALLEKERVFRDQIEAQRSTVREEWDGLDVRIPGYLLPLEYDGNAVVEFLLVPYVGACIHTPPPPANQIIHVRVESGIQVESLFTPVWVSGELSVEQSEQSVDLSDGASGFEVGYALQADTVENLFGITGDLCDHACAPEGAQDSIPVRA